MGYSQQFYLGAYLKIESELGYPQILENAGFVEEFFPLSNGSVEGLSDTGFLLIPDSADHDYECFDVFSSSNIAITQEDVESHINSFKNVFDYQIKQLEKQDIRSLVVEFGLITYLY